MNHAAIVTLDALKRLRAILEDPKAWVKGNEALDEKGDRVRYGDQRACSWCLTGALDLAVKQATEHLNYNPPHPYDIESRAMALLVNHYPIDCTKAYELLSGANVPAVQHALMRNEVQHNNDMPDTTHVDIVAWIDEAIARLTNWMGAA